MCAQNGLVRPVETQRILQREVLSAYTTNQRLVLQASQLEQDIQRLELINNQLIAADAAAAAAATTTAATTPTTTTTSAAVVGSTPSGRSRCGSAKGTKRRSGGSPVTPTGGAAALASSEKLKEKLEMKENLEAYSQRVNKLKSEVTAALTESLDGISSLTGSGSTPVTSTATIGEAGRAGQSHPHPSSLVGSVKQEMKFQPPDLSIKGLLEKTKTLPNGAMKHETVATVAYVSSSMSSSAASSDALLQPVVKSEAREVVNGAKRRKTVNGIVLPHSIRPQMDSSSSTNLQSGGNTTHSSIPGSSPLLSSSSSSPLLATSSSQDGKPTSPWADERLTLARDLIRFHETPVQQAAPLAMGSALVSMAATPMTNSCGGEVFSSAVTSSMETHRLQNNYSPISRPSSQSSTEGMDLPTSMSSAAAISRIAQSLTSQSTSLPEVSGLFHQSLATGGRLGMGLFPLSSVPLTVTVDVGAMSGGCVASCPLLPAPAALQAPQPPGGSSSSRKAKAAAFAGSTPVLTSALHTKGSSSSTYSKPQAAPPVFTTSSLQPEQQMMFEQQGQTVVHYHQPPPEMATQSVPARSLSRSTGKQPISQSTCFEVSTPSSTTAVMVPVSIATPSPTATSGNLGPLISHTVAQKPQRPASKTPQRRKNQRSLGASQPRQLQPQAMRPSHQVACLPNGVVPGSHAHHDVAKVLGASVMAPAGDGAVQMATVNGITQPLRLTAMPQAAQIPQKGECGTILLCQLIGGKKSSMHSAI